MLIHSPKQHKSITLSEPQGTLKTRKHQREIYTQLCAGREIKQNQTGELLWRDTGGITGEYWLAAPARYWPDTQQDPAARDTQRDTWRASYSGILSGVLGGIHWRAALVGYSAGSTGELLWRDTLRDALASYSGILSRILGGIDWRAAVVGYSAGSTNELLYFWLAGSTGRLLWWILGGIHWQGALELL